MIDVAARDFDEEIRALDQTLSSIEKVLDPARMRDQIGELVFLCGLDLAASRSPHVSAERVIS